jgi:N4-gp56 family major capsid protein
MAVFPSTPTSTNLIGTTVAGSVQRWLDKKFMEMPERAYESPLANGMLGIKASIPMNRGQTVFFRKFAKFTVPTLYTIGAEPSSSQTISSSTVEVAIKEFADYVELGNLLADTDYIDLLRKCKDALIEALQRGIHRNVNNALVNAISDSTIFSGTGTYSSAALTTRYTQGKSAFGELTADSYFTMQDFVNCRSRLRNDGVPKPYPGLYAAVVDDAVAQQLIWDDADFGDMVKRHEDKVGKAFAKGELFDYAGMRWTVQDDPYRCALPEAGGALATRSDTGSVHVAHVLGKGAYGYVQLGGKNPLKPSFKVQDITATGCMTTVGYRCPFRACVVDAAFGINLAGTTKYDKGVTD